MQTIAIIWAWPAGLMTAVTILENSENKNLHIDIFEKNPSPGKKLLLSGGGRCNVTTGITDKKILETKYTRGWDFIKKAIGKFWPKKCYEWFQEHGLKLKTEADNRVFPVSDDASEVLEVFENIFAKYRDNISLHYGEWVTEVSVIPGLSRDPGNNSEFFSTGFLHMQEWQEQTEQVLTYRERIDYSSSEWHQKQKEGKFQIQTKKWTYTPDILILASGGNAYAHTGSTGDGYAFARNLGHTITTLWPSLSSFLTWEKWLHELSGLAFESARIEHLTWPILLTHFGISGPLTFMFSSSVAWEKIEKSTPKSISLAPIASMHFEDWETFLRGEFQKHPKKLIASIVSEKLPRRFVDAFIHEFFSHISTTFVSSLARSDREKISHLLGHGIPLTLIERRPGDEFVTAGWVSTDEIDGETMESRIQKNLYFAGEILNVDGYTGGFSLQICWSSGYMAGKVIAWKVNED
jgi:predicted Rossmann fold flavoprotein